MPGSLTAWGLDVGNTSLKAVKLRREGQAIAIEAFDVVEHDKFLTEPDIDRDETIRHTLQKFLERNPIKKETVFIGVPGSSTFARFVKLPPVEPRKIPEIVRFEAIQQIPFPLEQVNWDYQTFISPESPEVEVGIFAMKKELVAQVMANFQANAMTIEGVQMSPLAVYNAAVFDEMSAGKGTVILDIGAASTDLIFIDSGRLWLRTINIGGNNFTDALSKSFKVPFSKAETLKRTAATSKYQKQIYQAMRPVFADLVAEIQRSIGFYNSGHRDSRLERIMAMGNTFKLPNLQKYIQQELKMEVVRLEHFRKANIDGKLAAGLNEHILAMTGAYGLALQGLSLAPIDTNLLPMDIARAMLWRKKRLWFAAAAAAIVIGVSIPYTVYHSADAAYYADFPTTGLYPASVTESRDAISRAKKDLEQFNSISGDYTKNEKLVKTYLALSDERETWPAIVHDLYDALPQAHDPAAGDTTLKYHERPILTITSITATYTDHLNDAAAPTATPDVPPGTPVNRNPADARDPRPSVAGRSPPTVPTTPAPVASSDRGFLIVVNGFTAYDKYGDLLRKFAQDFRNKAPEPSTDPKTAKIIDSHPEIRYFIIPVTPGRYTAFPLTVSPWGSPTMSHGPFYDAFVPEMLGLKVDVPVNPNNPYAAPAGLAPGSKPIDPETKLPMTGYQNFTTTFKVFFKPAP